MPKREPVDEKIFQKSVKDKVKGSVNEGVGKVRGRIGDLTDNGSEHIKGKMQEIKGKVQKKKGDIEEDLSVSRDRPKTDEVEED
jgi:uncharacterized protein YjbJ (UPF0337 family)